MVLWFWPVCQRYNSKNLGSAAELPYGHDLSNLAVAFTRVNVLAGHRDYAFQCDDNVRRTFLPGRRE
jgi:hypothetical protein